MTYNEIASLLNTFAQNHLALQRFQCSFFEQFDNFEASNTSFPILYAVPQDASMEQYIDAFTFRIYCVDILQKNRANEADVVNDTLLILRDLRNWLALADGTLNILNNPIAFPVNNFLVDYTAGWYFDITLENPVENQDCSIPFSSNFLLTGNTCSYSSVNTFLTCDTLASCQTILDLQGETISGVTFNNSTSILDITLNNSNSFSVSLSGLSTTDIYVSAVTFDSNNSLLSLNRNDGATLTTSLSGLSTSDYYVTGGTLNGQILDLNRNDGIQVSIPLSGLTYGCCITGATLNGTNYELLFNDGNIISTDLSSLGGNPYVTGGTISASTITLNKSDGNNVQITGLTEYFLIDVTSRTRNVSSGTTKVDFIMPFNYQIEDIKASLLSGATGQDFIVDINENGVSIFSTRLHIDAGSTTSVGSATPYVLSDNVLLNNSVITIDIDQVGSTYPGKHLVVYFKGHII